MRWFLLAAAGLHVFFMASELLPWRLPLLLRLVSRTLPAGESLTSAQSRLVATIVHNAGIYNGILAGGLCWAALDPGSTVPVGRVLLAGAVAAGTFGTASLRSPLTALQAVVGIVGLILL